MHYLGHRELSDGRKLHCLRAEKVSSAEDSKEGVKLSSRLATKRAQEALATQFSSGQAQGAALSPKRQQGSSLNKQVTAAPRTISHPMTPSWDPTSTAPASAVRPQQVQRSQQEPEAAPSQQRQQQPGRTVASLVAKCLRTQTGLDRELVGRALKKYFTLNGEEKESFGDIVLELAQAPSVEALQTFLEGMVEQN